MTNSTATKPTVIHSTFQLERRLKASPERVFAAFSDPIKKRKWFASGEKAQIDEYALDFRVGGRERTRFRFWRRHKQHRLSLPAQGE